MSLHKHSIWNSTYGCHSSVVPIMSQHKLYRKGITLSPSLGKELHSTDPLGLCTDGPMSEAAKAWETARSWRVEKRWWEISWWSFHQRENRQGKKNPKTKTNVGSCLSKWGQDVFLLYSTQREKHCLNIIKARKDNNVFQNSFLIFFIADNSVFMHFQYAILK